MPDKDLDLSGIGPIIDLAQPPARKATEYLNAYKSWTYSAVSLIARETSQIELKLYKRKYITSGGRTEVEIEEVVEHEAKSLLFHVNEFMTFGQFMEVTQIYLDLTGEAVWVILRNGADQPEQIWPLRPDWVNIKSSKDKYIDHYEYYPGGGYKKVILPAKDVIFPKYLNPVSAYRGKSAVEAGSMAIDIDEFSSDWNRTFFFNSALPYIFFSTEQTIGKEASERLLQMWRSKFEGRKNAHKVAFLGKGLKADVVGGNMKELDFNESKKSLRDEILAMFHISKANIGLIDDVNRASMEANNARFQSIVVEPRMRSITYYLNEFYLRNWEGEDLFFDFEDPTPENMELKIKIYENGLKYGWLTINEVRERENLAPVEGGDEIYLPMNVQPLGVEEAKGFFSKAKKVEVKTLKVKKKTKQQKLKESLHLPIPVKTLAKLRGDKVKKGLKHDLIELVVNLMKLDKDKFKDLKTKEKVKEELLTKENKEKFWKGFVLRTDVDEMRMRMLMSKLFDEQREDVYRNIENLKKGLADKMLFNIKAENAKWLTIMGAFIRELVAEKGEEIFAFLGMPRGLDLSTRRAANYLNKKGVKFIKSANETTTRKLRKTLAEGVIGKEGIPELKKRVDKIYNSASKHRSELIARSEVIRASNFATNEAYIQSEIVVGKEWVTALDERTCPWCNSLDGKIVPVKSTFFKEGDDITVEGRKLDLDYEDVRHPPLHPDCRCTLIPVIGQRSKKDIVAKKN